MTQYPYFFDLAYDDQRNGVNKYGLLLGVYVFAE